MFLLLSAGHVSGRVVSIKPNQVIFICVDASLEFVLPMPHRGTSTQCGFLDIYDYVVFLMASFFLLFHIKALTLAAQDSILYLKIGVADEMSLC